jgi:hypothetical protein
MVRMQASLGSTAIRYHMRLQECDIRQLCRGAASKRHEAVKSGLKRMPCLLFIFLQPLRPWGVLFLAFGI